MCWMAAIPIAMSAGQMALQGQQGEQAKAAQIDQSRRQQKEMIRSMNIEDANLRMQDRENLENTVGEMTQQNMQQVRSMSTIRSAIGEGMLEGKSMERVERVTQGDFAREQQGLTDSYNRDYASIFGKRISNREGTVAKIEAMQAAEPRLKGRLENMIDPLGIGLNKLVDMSIAGSGFQKKAKGITAKIQAHDAKGTGQKS